MKYLCLFLLGVNYCLSASNCNEVRTVYDFGSTSIKVAVAKVNHCHNKITEVLYKSSRRIDFLEDLNQSKSLYLSRKIIWKVLSIVSELQEITRQYSAQRNLVVGSSIFNKALNSPEIIKKLWKWFKLPMIILNQKQKGQIAFEAVSCNVSTGRSDIVVWEIGAGSMQISSLIDESMEPYVFEGFLASASFKKIIIEQVQNKNSEEFTSPNPISRLQGTSSIKILSDYTNRVPPVIREKIMDPNSKVYGIGGVHSYSIADQLGMPIYDLDSVLDVLNNSYELNDDEIGGDYFETQISNLILVAGFMKNLEIFEVYSLDISMADGVLVSNSYWLDLPEYSL